MIRNETRRVALGPRDLAILTAVADYRFLTREQVQRLFFGARSPYGHRRRLGAEPNGFRRACDRLKKLTTAGYLRRVVGPYVFFGFDQAGDRSPASYARPPYLYLLAELGAELVASLRGDDPDGLLVKKAHELSPVTLGHELALNDVRVALTLATEADPGWRLVNWLDTRAAYEEYSIDHPETGRPVRHVFAPDAWAHVRTAAGQDVGIFLELDRGTQSHRRITEKVRIFLDYARSGRFRARFGLDKFRVAFVTTATPARAKNLRRTVETQIQKVFWFTTRRQVLDQAERFFDAPIWLRAGDPDLRPFWLPSVTA